MIVVASAESALLLLLGLLGLLLLLGIATETALTIRRRRSVRIAGLCWIARWNTTTAECVLRSIRSAGAHRILIVTDVAAKTTACRWR